jgi:hypothetical protein
MNVLRFAAVVDAMQLLFRGEDRVVDKFNGATVQKLTSRSATAGACADV